MAVAFDAASSGDTGLSNATSFSWTHTAVGTPTIVVVGVSVLDSGGTRTVSGVTYGGVAMTQVPSAQAFNSGSGDRTDLWYLVNPGTGAKTVSVSLNGVATAAVGGAVTFTGSDTATPLGTAATNTQASGTSPSVTVSGASGDQIIAVVTVTAGTAITSGQTERWNRVDANAFEMGAGETTAGAASVAMGWTFSVGSPASMAGVAVKSAGAVAPIDPAYRPRRMPLGV